MKGLNSRLYNPIQSEWIQVQIQLIDVMMFWLLEYPSGMYIEKI